MLDHITIIKPQDFFMIRNAKIDPYKKLTLLADMCRLNTLSSVKLAGSGHLGSSLSSLDIVTWLYYKEMNTVEIGWEDLDRDIFFSSKGHDVPGLYSVLYSLELLSEDRFLKLRKLGGTFGHPDVSIKGIEANSGSLGMGISKGKGMAWSKRFRRNQGRVIVMTGDGELQEGQNFEALQTANHQQISNLIVIVDHNKVQSDKLVAEITDLGNLVEKFRSFGWYVERCDGHDFRALEQVFARFRQEHQKPKILIADTIKGKGVSFMEHPFALQEGQGCYRWHSGAPDDESFVIAVQGLQNRITKGISDAGLAPIKWVKVDFSQKHASGVSNEYVADAYGQALVDLAQDYPNLVVLDADLAVDCRVRTFEKCYPDRFIENGIAEQDMVSMAGGLALQGWIPVVNSFASFLASRANEQIFTNSCEKTKIIYACHYAGLIPAGPGQSHQSLRDISLFTSLPEIIIIQPCNGLETKLALEYFIKEAKSSCMLRMNIGPSPSIIELPLDYKLEFGKGVSLTEGADAILFAYGPIMLNEALKASLILTQKGFGLKVVNMAWLNKVDLDWLAEILGSFKYIYILEDHSITGGLGDFLSGQLAANKLLGDRCFYKFGIENYAACGTPNEVLAFHGLDGKSIAEKIYNLAL